MARIFDRASEWLDRNHQHRDFYLHIDSYDPHEPWDPPEELVKLFDPKGYEVPSWSSHPPHSLWRGLMSEEQFNSHRARYAAKVVLMDKRMGRLLDTMDRLHLWDNSLLIFMTDHGTYNGDHGRIGKGQSHEVAGKCHTPFILYHPHFGRGERRNQIIQNVDVYATVLDAFGKPLPQARHGASLLPDVRDAAERQSGGSRDYAVADQFGSSITITDGAWTLHQPPDPDAPLYRYSFHLSRFYEGMELGPFVDGRRHVLNVAPARDVEALTTWLTYRPDDPAELNNLADQYPKKVHELRAALRDKLTKLQAPSELLTRFRLG